MDCRKFIFSMIVVAGSLALAEVEPFYPRDGTYVYEVAWEGIPAGEVQIEEQREQGDLLLNTTARTYRLIDVFYKLRYIASASIDSMTFEPKWVRLTHKENSKLRVSKLDFRGSKVVSRYRRLGRPAVYTDFENTGRFLDPFSAAFKARSLEWALGRKHVFKTYNGRAFYEIAMTAVARENVRVAGRIRSAWVIEPSVKNLDKGTAASKLRSARIYLSDDSARQVLRIESEVFIGTVSCELAEFHAGLATKQEADWQDLLDQSNELMPDES
jgi:hypothetical protein